MVYNHFETLLSVPRLEKYRAACKQQKGRAMALYRANIRLSQHFYAIIGLLEITLRNKIDAHFTNLKGPFWLEDSVEAGGFLDKPECENSFHSVHEAIHRLGTNYTHDKLIAALSFGFWTHQFGKHEYPAAGNSALKVFPNRPSSTTYKKMLQELMKINILRNRIAHHEPICFDKFGNISTSMAIKRYALIKDLFQWMGCDTKLLFYGLDKIMTEAKSINKLAIAVSQRP